MYKVYCDDILIHDGSSPDKRVHLVNPRLKLSDSASGSFEASIPIINVGYKLCTRLVSTIYIYKRSKLIWAGRIIKESKNFSKSRQITCEGALSYLVDTIQELVRYPGYDAKMYVLRLLENHNSKKPANRQILPGTIQISDVNDGHEYQTNYKSTLTELSDNCIKRLGGHVIIRYRQSDRMAILDYVANYPTIAEQEINFGYNLLDFSTSWDITKLVTVLIPRGARLDIKHDETTGEDTEPVVESTIQTVTENPSTTISDGNQNQGYVGYSTTFDGDATEISGSNSGVLLGYTSSSKTNEQTEYLTIESVNGGSIYLVNETALSLYGRIEQTIDFSNVTDPNVLKALAVNYMNSQQFDTMQIKMSALDMHVLNPNITSFELLDIVHCISVPHGMNKYFPVLEIDIPLDSPQGVTYTLGLKTSEKTLTSSMVSNNIDMSNQINNLPSPTQISETVMDKVDNVLVSYAHVTNGLIDNARIDHANINGLQANYAHISEGLIDNAKISYADVDDLNVHYAHINNGVIDNANIDQANVNNLSTNYAHITNGVIDNATIDQASVNNLEATYAKIHYVDSNYAHINNGVIDNANIDQANVNNLSTNYAHIANGVIDNAKIDQADVNNLSSHYARIMNGVIDNAKISYADVDDLNVHYALVDMSNTSNAWIDQGTIREGAISNAMIGELSANKIKSGTLDASNVTVINLNASNITAGTLNGVRLGRGTVDLSKLSDDVYTEAEVDELLNNFRRALDGAIEIFTGNVVPSMINFPVTSWIEESGQEEALNDSSQHYILDSTDDSIKTTLVFSVLQSHIGDIYYVMNPDLPENQKSYRFVYMNGVYSWEQIGDSDLDDVIQRIATAENKISNIEVFDTEISTWKTETDTSISSIISEYTTLSGSIDKAIVKTNPIWISKSSTAIPSKPSAHVVEASTNGNTWTTKVPAYNSLYPYYFYCYEHEFVDGTYGWSDVVYDQTMSEQEIPDGIISSIQLWTNRNNLTTPIAPSGLSTSANNIYTEYLVDSNGTNILDNTGNKIPMQNPWTISLPAYNTEMSYYFYCWEYLHNDGTYSWSTPVYDRVTSDLQRGVDSVNGIVTERINIEESTWSELRQGINENSFNITSLKTITETAVNMGVEYIAGSQTSSTPNWTGISTSDTLYIGKKIVYKLPYASSSNVTLTLSLANGSTTGAIPVYINGTRVSNQFAVGSVIDLTYDGANWRATGYWTEDTFNRTQYNSNIKATSTITSGHLICGDMSGYKNLGANTTFKLDYPILYARESITADSSGSNNDIMASNINYSTSGTIESGAISKVLYLKGTVNGGTFTIAGSNWLTTVTPSSNSSYYYIPLGVMSSTTNGSFSSSSSLWKYFDDKFQPAAASVVTTSNTVNEVKQTAETNSASISNLTTRLGTNADGTAKENDIVHKYSSLQQTLDSFQTTVSNTYATKTDIDNYIIGGRNLLRNTKEFSSPSYSDSNGVFIFDSSGNNLLSKYGNRYMISGKASLDSTYLGFSVRKLISTTALLEIAKYSNVFKPQPDMYMIFSFYAKGTGSITAKIPSGNNQELIYAKTSSVATFTSTDRDGSCSINLPSTWMKLWICWNIDSNSTPIDVYRNLVILADPNTTVYICGLKLETGNHYTDWSPAPEDSEENVADVIKSVNAIIDRVDQNETNIIQTADSIITSISSASSTLVDRMDGIRNQEIMDRNAAISASADSINLSVSNTYATKTALNNETTNRTNAINSAVTTEVADRNNAINSAITTEVINRNTAITASANSIISSVSQTYATKTALNNEINDRTDAIDDAISTEIENRNSAISQSASNIELSVSRTYSTKSEVSQKVNSRELIASINLSSESAKISANKVDIEGSAAFTNVQNNGIVQSQYIYRSSSTSTQPNNPSSKVTDTTGRQNRWTLYRPEYDPTYPYLWVGTQRIYLNNDFTIENVHEDKTTTVIDGGRIRTNSLNADRIIGNTLTIGKLDTSLQNRINELDSKVNTTTYNADLGNIRESIVEAAKTASNYLTYDQNTGELILGTTSSSQIKNVMTNSRQVFKTSAGEIAGFGLNSDVWEMFIETADIKNRLKFNSFSWIARANGNMTLKWVG